MKKLRVRKKKSRATVGGISQSAFADLEKASPSTKTPEKKERVSKQLRDCLDPIKHDFTFVRSHKSQQEGESNK